MTQDYETPPPVRIIVKRSQTKDAGYGFEVSCDSSATSVDVDKAMAATEYALEQVAEAIRHQRYGYAEDTT